RCVRKTGQHRRDHRADERKPNRVTEARRGDADRPVDASADHVADAEDDEARKPDAPGERGLAPIRRVGGAPHARIAHAEFSVAAAPRLRRHYSLVTGAMSTRIGRSRSRAGAVGSPKVAELVASGRPDGHPTAKAGAIPASARDRKSTRLNSSHVKISYAVFCLKKKIYRQK